MNPDTTPTPRTDSVAVEDTYGDGEIVLASFSRKLERELAEKTNEVARLNQYIRNMQEIIDDDTKQKSELHNEVARLRELCEWAETLLCNSEHQKHCAEWEWNKIVKNWRDQFHGLAPAPEETQDGATMQEWYGGFSKIESTEPSPECKCDYTSIIRATHNGYTYDQCSKCGKKFGESFEKEPTPEWRQIGPDEVICEGDEYCSHSYVKWRPIDDDLHNTQVSQWSGSYRFRTRRPLPPVVDQSKSKWFKANQPLEKELNYIEHRGTSLPDSRRYIADAIRYLRDEIQKLKATVNKTTPNY